METGRPVLVVPPNAPWEPGGVCMVSWNGRPEAAHAIQAAMPLLELADEVVVVEVDHAGTNRGVAAGQVVEYLSSHSVTAKDMSVDSGERSIGRTLVSYADILNARTLVMGAMAHSRLRRLMFGGVTRDVLTHTRIPVLMAH